MECVHSDPDLCFDLLNLGTCGDYLIQYIILLLLLSRLFGVDHPNLTLLFNSIFYILFTSDGQILS